MRVKRGDILPHTADHSYLNQELKRSSPPTASCCRIFVSQLGSEARVAAPSQATAQGHPGHHVLRGFGAMQWNITLRRQFRFTERVSLQARGDFFNILNHPNFGSPINYLTSPQFGQSTQMLNS